jgi:hypothetical protein
MRLHYNALIGLDDSRNAAPEQPADQADEFFY